MPKRFSSDQIIKILKKSGFVLVSQKGSHIKFRANNRTVIVPAGKKEIPIHSRILCCGSRAVIPPTIGTFRSILRQSGLELEDFR